MLIFKKKIYIFCVSILLIAGGYFIGNFSGNLLIKRFVIFRSPFVYLLYRPAYEYLYTIKVLASQDDLDRLKGYYSLWETKKIDEAFLIERYKKENSLLLKRSIIFILGFSNNKDIVSDFSTIIYKDSPWRIKMEILRTIKRLDGNLYIKFISDNKINIKEFKGL
ncbi:MAG: hypothetical protein SVR08_11355 [Spirochaetota bacterium]|nr:hypothetical protein [Spirochaetota bacterium]